MKQSTTPLANGIRMTVAHDWIRLDLGNGRGLTTSYSRVKASGNIPGPVFEAWCKAAELGDGIIDRIRAFGETVLPSMWPDWDTPPETAALKIGARVALSMGKRTLLGVVRETPKRAGQRFAVQFDGERALTMISADLLAVADQCDA